MLIQYQILNMCLFQLHKSRLSTVSKLKLEVQLYHLKRLLLMDEVAAVVKDNTVSEKEFMSLYECFKNMVTDDSTTSDIEGLILQQNELKEAISSLYEVEGGEPSQKMICAMLAPFATNRTAEQACRPEDEPGGSDGEDSM